MHSKLSMFHWFKDQNPRRMLLLIFCVMAGVCSGPAQDVVCNGGFGSFTAGFATGVTVSVGAKRNGNFAGRTCIAKLDWAKQELLVEPDAWQVDVDAMGIDLGLGSPVVAFQTKATELQQLQKYEIYSLKKPPRLLRTITGGAFYSAADTDLDGRIEIWTNDAGVVTGFENIPLSALEFPPTIVLRFEQKKLIDVSSEFASDYNRRVATVRAQLDPRQLSEFKHSDGALLAGSYVPMDQLHRLITTKTKVLEIVWSYLYSAREQQAWNALADMWPTADFDRIRAAILLAQARGIRSQVDAISHQSRPSQLKRKHAMIYDRISEADPRQQDPLSWDYAPGASGPGKLEHTFEPDIAPIQILLRRPPPPDATSAALGQEVVVNLVIDAAGKVRSATEEGKIDKDLMDATADWKFIPAFKDGRPVASRLRLGIAPLR